LNANTLVPNTRVRELLGRLPGIALATQNTTVNLLTNGQMYPPERVTQLDMRFAKILRFGQRRADIGVDLYNLFNTADTTAYDQNYDYGVANGGEWLLPTQIVRPRYARFNVTFSF
jgi:hypothetical protein